MDTETTTQTKSLALVNKEINKELADPAIVKALLATTFKDFDEKLMKQAIFEGIIRGFKFKEFLEKDVYAIKYGSGYSLVTSIGHARKIGSRSGVVGKKAPEHGKDAEGDEICSVTVLKKTGDYVGEFTASVYFGEYDTGKNQWQMRPKTMIAKVAEMHALRMACPEELSQVFTEEEFDKNREQGGDTYTVVRKVVAEDAPVTFEQPKGEDENLGEGIEIEVPKTPTERRKMLLDMLKKYDPSLDLTDEKAIQSATADLTQLEYTEKNYSNIIHILSRRK